MRKNKYLRRGLLVAGVLLVPLMFAFSWWYCTGYYPRKNTVIGPVHAFTLDPVPAFLSDTLAGEKATEAIARDGHDPTQWHPRENRRGTAPDGTRDVYFHRNGEYHDLGEIEFVQRNGDSLPRISVAVELSGNQVRCRVSYMKYAP